MMPTTQDSAAHRQILSRQRVFTAMQAVAVVGIVAFWMWALTTHPAVGGKPFGVDAEAYWGANLQDPYVGPAVGRPGAYLYSPAFLQAFAPLQMLPWDWFIALWLGVQLAALAWLVTPLGALVMVLAFPPATSEVLIGNIHVLLAAALVVSMRYPTSWALALLTKPSLGVGVTWYLARHEWSRAAVAVGSAAAIALVSMTIAPHLWFEWYQALGSAQGTGGFAWTAFFGVRLVGALLIAWYAGARDRPALLAIALYLALPIPWLEGLTLLAAVPRLLKYQMANNHHG